MYELGNTRTVHRPDQLLLTPDTFVRAPLPGMSKATAIVHVGPAIGARFTQYTAEFDEGGVLGPATTQRFVYVIDGELLVERRTLGPADFAYLPPASHYAVTAKRGTRAA